MDCLIVSHFKDHHPGIKPFNCNINSCYKKFNLRHQQRSHMKFIHLKATQKKPTAYKCQICKTYFSSQGTLNAHIESFHVLPLVMESKETKSENTNGNKYLETTKVNSINSNVEEPTTTSVCNECGKSVEKSELKSHLKTVHEIDTDITCQECGKNFKTSYKLNLHLKMVHKVVPSKSQFECPDCLEIFECKSSMLKHAMIHRTTDCVCESCGKRFKKKFLLNRHVKTQHNGLPKTVQCRVCDNRFGSFMELKHHAKSHSKGNKYCKYFDHVLKILEFYILDDYIPKYICNQCGEGFMVRATMIKHFRKRHEGRSTMLL